MSRVALALLALVAVASTSAVARASPGFPDFIHMQPGATCAPDCTVCHSSESGGYGTVVQPFGQALLHLGLVAENTSSLLAALDAARSEALDVNCDGVPDVQELFACMNPNVTPGDAGSACVGAGAPVDPVPQYGCAVGGGPRGLLGSSGAGVLAAFAFLACRRRARRAPRERADLEVSPPPEAEGQSEPAAREIDRVERSPDP